MIFCEIFAGKGVLTKAVEELSMKAETPDDFQHGGTDFRSSKQVEALKSKLANLAAQANHLVVHLAPPWATFSRARDRCFKTRLRSGWCPEGLPGKQVQTKEANQIARRAYALAIWAADELGALVSLETRAAVICGSSSRSTLQQNRSGRTSISRLACMERLSRSLPR